MNNRIMNPIGENAFSQILLNLLDKYYKVLNDHDIEGILDMIHRDSPAQSPTKQVLDGLFNTYRLNNVLLGTKNMFIDDDYVYLRMKQKTTRIEGPEFKDNISDSLVVFRKEERNWKVWNIMTLDVEFI